MEFTIEKLKEGEYSLYENMVFGLYNDDADENQEDSLMNSGKITKTVERSFTNPEQVEINLFKVKNSIVGYALLTFFWSNEYGGLVALIDELYLIPEFRNKGIATTFITELAHNKNYSALNLEVFKENSAALNLYRRVGFEIVDRHFMIKRL